LAVRAFEWRRFGFGIASSFQARLQPEIAFTLLFNPAAEIGQRCPPWVCLICIAGTDFMVSITATAGADSFALLLAENSSGQRQQNLLTQNVLNRKTALFIVTDFRVGGRDGAFRASCVHAGGPKNQIERFFEVLLHRIQAPGTQKCEITLVFRSQTDVMNNVVSAPVFCDQVGAAAHRQTAYLLNAGSEVDRTSRDRFAELNRLPFEVEHRNDEAHGNPPDQNRK
jgi:hypothetical protein